MAAPIRRKRRLTLAREFRNSVKAGPRVWLIAAGVFLCLVGLPLLSKLASFLAMILVGVGLLFIAPVILRAVIAGLADHLKRTMVFQVFTANATTATGGAAPAMKRAAGTLVDPAGPGRENIRRAEVIEVEAVSEERKSPVL